LNNETFILKEFLVSTINNFPGYSNLLGWKTKGKFACPYCNVDASSLYLKRSRKMCIWVIVRRPLMERHK